MEDGPMEADLTFSFSYYRLTDTIYCYHHRPVNISMVIQ